MLALGKKVGMKKAKIALLILILATLACGVRTVDSLTPEPTQSNPSQPLATVLPPSTPPLYVVAGNVYIHKQPDVHSPIVGILQKDAVVPANCYMDNDWCDVFDGRGYVWAGCLGFGEKGCREK